GLTQMEARAVVESRGGVLYRVKLSREDLMVEYEREVTYSDNTSKLFGVRATTTNRSDGKKFTVTAKEGQVHDNPTSYTLDCDVQLAASDGLAAKSEHASYSRSDAPVRAPGPMPVAKRRMAAARAG